MARKMIVTLTDDLDNQEIPEGGGETVVFALDGKTYELDLKHDNARKLRDTMGTYVKVARVANPGNEKRRGSRPVNSAGRTDRNESKTIRAWARSQGMTVPDRGRIPGEVIDEWEALSGTEKALAQSAVAGQQSIPATSTGTSSTPPVDSPPEFSDKTQGKASTGKAKADTPKASEKQPVNA